ncbi:hypothetical protein G6F22_020670 [Rhizopus arrhizus]|nr:hypothetical protein G6F22_020670 [Rhizopus arrhizus]
MAPVATVAPFRLLNPSNVKLGLQVSQTPRRFRVPPTTFTGAPRPNEMAVHSGPWREKSALREMTAASALVDDEATSMRTSSPSSLK